MSEPQQAMVFDTPEKIEMFKLICVRQALRINKRGFQVKAPRSALQVLQQDYGFEGKTVDAGLEYVEELILARGGPESPR